MCGQPANLTGGHNDIILKGTGVPRISCPRGTCSPRIKCSGGRMVVRLVVREGMSEGGRIILCHQLGIAMTGQ